MTAEQSRSQRIARQPPGRVLWFERLFYFSAALSVARFAINWPGHMPVVAFLVVYALLVLQLFLIWLTARRRKNWARWVLLVFFIVWTTAGLFYDGMTGGIELKLPSTADAVLRLLQLLFEDIGLILIFTGRSTRRWFMPAGAHPTDWPP
jgi:hypothetical protein